jgi:hypothetical protein
MKITEAVPNVPMSAINPRGGIDLTFDLDCNEGILTSEIWKVAGRKLQFVFLAAHQTLKLADEACYLKVIVGRLDNIGRGCFAEPFAIRSTRVGTAQVLAGAKGALFALLTETDETPRNLYDMAAVKFSDPLSEHLDWQSFDEKFGVFTDAFAGQDCHMMNGFHLLDQNGSEIAYVNFWTCGKGVDLSTHDHGGAPSDMAPAFAEVHWVINPGTGSGGMYQTESPGHPDRVRHTLARGDEHGPYFEINPDTRKPVIKDNGAVKYPWHGWQGGQVELPGQSYDFVAAFEINPAYATV